MANNDILLVDGIIDGILAEKNLQDTSGNRGKEFEIFAISEILKSFDLTEKELENGIVDGADDGGIDGFYIFLNGIPVVDISEFRWPKSNVALEIYIITCKHHDTYELNPLESLDSSLSEVFDLQLDTANFKSKLNEAVIQKRKLLVDVYRKVGHALDKCIVNIVYVSRGNTAQVAPDILAKGHKLEDTCRKNFIDCIACTTFWGTSELITQYRKKRNGSVELKTIKCFQSKTDFIALVALDDYYLFVTDDNRKLKRYYFEENVRDYLGENRTNVDIYATLENDESPDFWLLNNGITMLVSSAVLYDGKLAVENVQIVNGLQTTNTIYQYYSGHPQDKAGRCLLVKVICSTEENIRNQIIQATNNQSTIPLYSLHATDKIQKDIEMVMLQYGLYYERKTNYYKNLNCDSDKIFAPLYLAGGYVALILKLPRRAAMLKSKFMNSPEEYQRVFSEKSDLRVWPQIAMILRRVDKEAEKNRATVKAGTETYLKTVRPIVAILCIARSIGKFCFGEQDLIALDLEQIEQETISATVSDVVSEINKDETIRTIKDVRQPQKMKRIIEKLGNKYGIPDFASIRNRPDITPSDFGLTEGFLKKVKETLPPQPWPVGIHKQIAKQLKCNPAKVSRAISIQVDRGVFRKQINGVLVDSTETQK